MSLSLTGRRIQRRSSGMIRYQSQAVLRRVSRSEPLLLVGITLNSTFFPKVKGEETGVFLLTKGLVALAPLSAVDAPDAERAAAISMADATETWNGPFSPGLPASAVK
jgi:hypothetical protein